MGWKLYTAFHEWSGDLWGKRLKCRGKRKTGCMTSIETSPTPLALTIALQPQFSLIFFLHSLLPWILLCVKEKKKKASPLLNIYLSLPQRTQATGRRVNLFSFCFYFTAFILMLTPHSLFQELYILWFYCSSGAGIRKCSHFCLDYFDVLLYGHLKCNRPLSCS